MPKRRCRNPLRTDGLTRDQVIQMAIEKLEWPRAKVLSWYEKENASLKKARPRELVERGDTDRIVDLLNKREYDRKSEQRNKEERQNGLPSEQRIKTNTFKKR